VLIFAKFFLASSKNFLLKNFLCSKLEKSFMAKLKCGAESEYQMGGLIRPITGFIKFREF